MSNLEITFIGICTHLWETQNAPPNPAYGTRIVMPNAVHPVLIGLINLLYGFDPPIMPHFATLAFPVDQFDFKEGPKEFFPWNGSEGQVHFTFLDGVTVTVKNPAPTDLVKDARCIPGLGAFLPGVAPGPAATSSDRTLAAGYFDFQNGTVLGTGELKGKAMPTRGDAGVILYKTPTNGAPQILITPFDTDIAPTTVHLKGDATVYIANIPILELTDCKDNDNDFILHYLVANQFPPPPWPPASPPLNAPCLDVHPYGEEIIRALRICDDFGAGCSNSNLP